MLMTSSFAYRIESSLDASKQSPPGVQPGIGPGTGQQKFDFPDI